MIIELFGPAGAGKTTFSHLLATRLRERGYIVELVLSRRPSEPSDAKLYQKRPRAVLLATIRRLLRPVFELVDLIAVPNGHPDGYADGVRQARSLLLLLPQRSLVRTLRFSQYLVRLHSTFRMAALARHVVIFDQGFVQAVYTLAVDALETDAGQLRAAIGQIPTSDVLIDVAAPVRLLRARLQDRIDRQSRVERIFEQDLELSLPKDDDVLGLLRRHLPERSTVLQMRSDDPRSVEATMDEVERMTAVDQAFSRQEDLCTPIAHPLESISPERKGRRQ